MPQARPDAAVASAALPDWRPAGMRRHHQPLHTVKEDGGDAVLPSREHLTRLPRITRSTIVGCNKLVGDACRLATCRNAFPSTASWRAAMCSLPIYQLMKRTLAGRGPA